MIHPPCNFLFYEYSPLSKDIPEPAILFRFIPQKFVFYFSESIASDFPFWKKRPNCPGFQSKGFWPACSVYFALLNSRASDYVYRSRMRTETSQKKFPANEGNFLPETNNL